MRNARREPARPPCGAPQWLVQSLLWGARLRGFTLVTALATAVAAAACGDRSGADRDAAGSGADGGAADSAADAGSAGAGTPSAATGSATAEWPATGAIHVRRERAVDFTGDGAAERVIARAHGPAYDSLAVELAIIGARGDTLWFEQWPSLHYFKYDAREGKPDSAVARIVRGHVDALLDDANFTTGGLPAALQHGDASARREAMREAVAYHLAELDWRNSADLTPADATPPDAHSRLNAGSVAGPRVAVVIEELMQRPAFMYYAGGEATYAIAWSERENGFVRIYACC